MSRPNPPNVVILFEGEGEGGDFGRSFAAGFRAHGCAVRLLPRSGEWDGSPDLVVAYGPFQAGSSMVPVARRLLRRGPARPRFAWWLTEGVPPLWLPRWSVELLGRARVALDEALRSRPGRLRSRGHRLRIVGELSWLQARGVLDVLAVTSAGRAAYLRRAGFDPVVVPLGYEAESYGRDLGLARDVDVCFIGSLGSRRRRVLLERIGADLAERGIRLTVRTQLYGEERTRFLNRTRIMLNILRAPQDFVGQRFLLAAANGALVVSEPLRDGEPFVNGRHIVSARVDALAGAIQYYLEHEPERVALAEAARRLVQSELSIEQMTGRILAQVPGMSVP